MHKHVISIIRIVLASLIFASCTSPTPLPPVSVIEPTLVSTAVIEPTLTRAPTPTVSPTATPTTVPTETPQPQERDEYGFIQLGLLKVKVADNSLYQDKSLSLNTKDYPEAQQIVDRAILAAFAILRSGSFDDPAAQVQKLKDDISKGSGRFQIWAEKAKPDGTIDYIPNGKGEWLTVDPAKGITLILKTSPNDLSYRSGTSGFGNLYGVTEDGQLVVYQVIWQNIFGQEPEFARKINGFISSLTWMMLGHDPNYYYKNRVQCCEGKFPQLFLRRFWSDGLILKASRTIDTLMPYDILTDFTTTSSTDLPSIIPTLNATQEAYVAMRRPTDEAALAHVTSNGQVLPIVTGLSHGSMTFTLRLENKNTQYAFTISNLNHLMMTDDITPTSSISKYELDNSTLFDFGFAATVLPGQTISIPYALKSPISSIATAVNFEIRGIYSGTAQFHNLRWRVTLP